MLHTESVKFHPEDKAAEVFKWAGITPERESVDILRKRAQPSKVSLSSIANQLIEARQQGTLQEFIKRNVDDYQTRATPRDPAFEPFVKVAKILWREVGLPTEHQRRSSTAAEWLDPDRAACRFIFALWRVAAPSAPAPKSLRELE